MSIKYKALCAAMLPVLILVFSFTVWAHPGRTDSSGGHYNRSTGEYHYHHGYPAHQHPGGVCPYDYNDLADHTSTSSSYLVKEKSEIPGKIIFAAGAILSGFCTFTVRGFQVDYLKKERDKLNNTVISLKEKIADYEIEIESLISDKKQLTGELLQSKDIEKQYLKQIKDFCKISDCSELMSYDEILAAAKVPEGVTFDENDLPHYHLNEVVESHMKVYIAPAGKKYHRIQGCSRAYTEVHLFSVNTRFAACERCFPVKAWDYTLPEWYFRYIQLISRQRTIAMEKRLSSSEKLPEQPQKDPSLRLCIEMPDDPIPKSNNDEI